MVTDIYPLAQNVECTDDALVVSLVDGRIISVSLEWFPRLAKVAREHRDIYEILGDGEGIHWPVAVAMEGYDGYARPLDRLVRARDYRLYNINNLKLARFKEIFPAAAKTDAIDARKGLELFQLRDHLLLAKGVLQEVAATPAINAHLKRLTRLMGDPVIP